MATTSSFPSLQPPPQDDQMEMSSPTNRILDDDIDIDFEDYHAGQVQLIDDENMLDDVEQRPGTADDAMEDDYGAHQEQTMQYEIVPDQQDDELIDYGDDEYDDVQEKQGQASTEVAAERPSTAVDAHEAGRAPLGDEQTVAVSVNSPVADDSTKEASPSQSSTDITAARDPTRHDDQPVSYLAGAEEVPAEEVPVDETDESGAHVGEGANEDGDHTDKQSKPQLLETYNLASESTVDVPADAPGTPTDTGLHSMILNYDDLTFPLFKSRNSPEGLLKDDNLVSVSLAELISTCRQRLAIKTQDEIDDGQEFVMAFDGMGLAVVEDSQASFETSLNDVLEVFMKLHGNDGVQSHDIPPLNISCTLQLKFSNSLAVLKGAADNGQGMSSFAFMRTSQDDDDVPSQINGEEDLVGVTKGDDSANDGEANAADHSAGYEYDQAHDHEQASHDTYEEQHDDRPYDEDQAETYDAEGEDWEEEPLGKDGETAETDPITLQNIHPHPSKGETSAISAHHSTSVSEAGDEAANADSAASSTTLRADGVVERVSEHTATSPNTTTAEDHTNTGDGSVDFIASEEHANTDEIYEEIDPQWKDDDAQGPQYDEEDDVEAYGFLEGDEQDDSANADHPSEDVAFQTTTAANDQEPAEEDSEEYIYRETDKSNEEHSTFELNEDDEQDFDIASSVVAPDHATGPTDVQAASHDEDNLCLSSAADDQHDEEASELLNEPENATSQTARTVELPHADSPSGTLDSEDDIGFDDDTTEQYEARMASIQQSNTPTKRAREEDGQDDDAVDVKRTRSS